MLPFLIPMLERAGAYVMTPRERDTGSLEVICDNNPHFRSPGFPVRTHGTYKEKGGSTDYLNETKEYADEKIEEALDWVAFKNQFFSAVMISKDGFANNSLMTSLPQEKGSNYLKQYGAKVKTAFDPKGATPTELEFYFGPNDFRLLQAVEKQSTFGKDLDLERLVYLGWPLFRIINRWFTLYVFDWLTKLGLPMGIVLILIFVLMCGLFGLEMVGFIFNRLLYVFAILFTRHKHIIVAVSRKGRNLLYPVLLFLVLTCRLGNVL